MTHTITRNAGGKPEKPLYKGLNSKALAGYARRTVWRANFNVLLALAIGASFGYGLVMLTQSYAALSMALALYGVRVPPLPIIPYMDMALPIGFALLFGLFAANRADEARFRAQLALHILYVQHLLEHDKDEPRE